MTDTTTITLKFTIAQVNALLQWLGNGPYVQVEPIITEIRNQALPQVPPEPEQEQSA